MLKIEYTCIDIDIIEFHSYLGITILNRPIQ